MSDCTKLDGAVHVDSGAIGSILLRYAWPILLSQLAQEMYNVADCAVVGRFAGEFALAAAGTAALPMSVAVNFFVGFSSGASTLIASLFGARRHDDLTRMISSVMRMTFVSGLLLSAVIFLLSGSYLTFTAVPADVAPFALVYLRICSLGVCAQMINNMATAVLRSVGDSRSPMRLFLFSAAVNLAGDLLLVVGMHAGIAGAAAATAASQWILSVMLLLRLRRLDPDIRFFGSSSGSDTREQLMTVLGRGIPAGLQAFFMSVSSILIRFYINGFGADAIGGMNVFARIEGLCYLPSFAYGIALTAFVGQNLGAGQPERIRDSVRLSIRWMFIIMLPLTGILCVLAPVLARIFTEDSGIIMNAAEAVRYTLPLYTVYAVNQVYLGAVKGMGNTVYPMKCTFVCYALFRVIWCALLIGRFHTMKVVYLSYAVSFLIMTAMILPVYIRMIRRECSPAGTHANA